MKDRARRLLRALPALALAATSFRTTPLAAQGAGKEPSVQDRALSQWIAILASDDPAAQVKAAQAIKSIGRPAVPALSSATTSHADAAVRGRFIPVLAEIGGGDVAATLSRLLQTDSDSSVRLVAAESLGELARKADPKASAAVAGLIPRLIAAMEGSDYGDRDIYSMLLLIGEPARPALTTAALSHSNPRVRQRSVAALAGMGGPGRVATLVKTLSDPDSTVRAESATMLGFGGVKGDPEAASAVRALARALMDQEVAVRREAARALGMIGSPARTAIPALRALLTDSSWSVRDAAEEALKELEGK